MDAINELESGGIEPERKDPTMSKEDLLTKIGIVFNAVKNSRSANDRIDLRNATMEDLVKALLQALNKVRPLDNRNTELVSDVRKLFYYGANVVDPDDLFGKISEVLNKKIVNPQTKVEENIMNHVEDDLDDNLNINNFLNGN